MLRDEFPIDARVFWSDGSKEAHGVVQNYSLSARYVFVQFDGSSYAVACMPEHLTLDSEVEVGHTVDMSGEDILDPIIRQNKFKDFETESAGHILEDEEIYQRGFEDAFTLVQDALDKLRSYEALGTPDELARDARRGAILFDHINDQPAPVKQAWKKHLADKKAL